MPKKVQKQSNGYCYTINNYTDDEIAFAMSLFDEDDNAKYQIIGFETAPRTGTKHLQCYIYYTNKVDFNVMIKRLYPHHVEPQKSTSNVAAYCYCMEDGDYYEQGERPRQGYRTNLEVIKHDLINGKTMKQVSNEHFSQWCQYRRAFKEFIKLHDIARPRTKVITYVRDLYFHDYIRYFYDSNRGSKIMIADTLSTFACYSVAAAQGKYDYILVDIFYVPEYDKSKFTTLAEWVSENI